MLALKYEIAALAAAMCWAVTPLLSAPASAHLGALAFNRLRQVSVTLMLAVFVIVTARLQAMVLPQLLSLLASGLVGIFAGDTLLFLALNRVGPRRASILFALNAPLAAVLGWIVLGEDLSVMATFGIAVTCAGVMLAILYGKRTGSSHRFESLKGKLWIGVALGLGAALGQACGSIIARPVMATGFDPYVASMLRVGAAACCLTVVMALPYDAVKPRGAMTPAITTLTIASGVLAMGIGMTLLLFALSGGKTGIVSTLSATSPVLILPLLWIKTGERPAAGAWAGAALAIAGMAMIFGAAT